MKLPMHAFEPICRDIRAAIGRDMHSLRPAFAFSLPLSAGAWNSKTSKLARQCRVCNPLSTVIFQTFACASLSPSSPKSGLRSDNVQAGNRGSSSCRGDKLVLVGLGNPGPQYDNTRHNVGFMLVTQFASRNRAAAFRHEKRFQAEVADVRIEDKKIIVVRPRTFMNNSGQAVRAIMDYYNVPLGAVLVVADDMALELGRVRLRAKGSAGGHNGLRSVEKHAGSQQYARLKVGVGSPSGGANQWSGHVLGRFSRGDLDILENVTWDAMDIIEEWVREADVGRVMNAFTRRQQKAKK